MVSFFALHIHNQPDALVLRGEGIHLSPDDQKLAQKLCPGIIDRAKQAGLPLLGNGVATAEMAEGLPSGACHKITKIEVASR